ncbi:MAG: 16S rRNA (cytosine(1402)-N(4))-methyltransferase RsmH [Candidatus Riflebacteria bacterium]|nr:16S rRNA (cytosine(1402)-N(4))-methyltransferase RsmH [Candidatus Riflebacteria bacterium]
MIPERQSPAVHLPVLPKAILEHGFPADGRVFVDGTFGMGGHTRLILEYFPGIERAIGLDRDARILALSATDFNDPRLERVHAQASALGHVLEDRNISGIDGFLLDLGVSSYQLDTPDRGFSFMRSGPLDMRMDTNAGLTAADLVNTLPEDRLVTIFFRYGEERLSRRIAAAIVRRRAESPFYTTLDLAETIVAAFPAAARRSLGIHPATRVFQALRIAVNDELGELEKALEAGIAALNPCGRIAVISFHSLEDRIVKERFFSGAHPCQCPPTFPVCNCHKKPVLRLITRKPLTADLEEITTNPRARSAKLRIAEKLL